MSTNQLVTLGFFLYALALVIAWAFCRRAG